METNLTSSQDEEKINLASTLGEIGQKTSETDIRYEKDYAAFYSYNKGMYDDLPLPEPLINGFNKVMRKEDTGFGSFLPDEAQDNAKVVPNDSALNHQVTTGAAVSGTPNDEQGPWITEPKALLRESANITSQNEQNFEYSHPRATYVPRQPQWAGFQPYEAHYAEHYSSRHHQTAPHQQQQRQQQVPGSEHQQPQLYQTAGMGLQLQSQNESAHNGFKQSVDAQYGNYTDSPQTYMSLLRSQPGSHSPYGSSYGVMQHQQHVGFNGGAGPGSNYYGMSSTQFKRAEQHYLRGSQQYRSQRNQYGRRNKNSRSSERPNNSKYYRKNNYRHGNRSRYRHPYSARNGQHLNDGQHAHRIVSSPIHFPAVITPEYITNKVISMSKDQNGCRILQKKIQERDPAIMQIILTESEPHLTDMMVEPFGNYLFQKFLENVTEEWKTKILDKVVDHLVIASLSIHGTRSVQKIVEHCTSDTHVEQIVATLAPAVVDLSKNSNGNHVVQKCLKHQSSKTRLFVIRAVTENTKTISMHRHGCCVVQRCLDATTPLSADTQDDRSKLVDQIIAHAMTLMQNAYGNYVIQYLVENGTEDDALKVIRSVIGHTSQLAQQKYSSNVVEKCLVKAPFSLRAQMIEEISSPAVMQVLLFHRFANYVVQRALKVASPQERLLLVRGIQPHTSGLMHNAGGRKILELCRDELAALSDQPMQPVGMPVATPHESQLGTTEQDPIEALVTQLDVLRPLS